jgi:20S proteasome alpha/beta subunit
MTTIAVDLRAGVMAADRRVVTSSSYYHADKIFRIGASLFGTAGHGMQCLAFIEWLKSRRIPAQLHKLMGDYDREGIIIAELNPLGIFIWDGWGFPEKVRDDVIAIGSGGMAALEAMRHGVSAEDAVRRAMAHDECTGGEVQVCYLDEPPLKIKAPNGRRKKAN